MANLTQKETMLLKDLKHHEEWCIKKYTNAASSASDPELKTVFTDLASQEQQHLNTLNQIEQGQTPTMGQSQQVGQGQSQYNFEMGSLGNQTQPKQTQQKSNQQYLYETGHVNQQQPSSNPFTKSYQQSNTSQQSTNPNQQVASSVQPNVQTRSAGTSQTDIDLCYDLLNTEKFVSSTYNTAIFEFTDKNNRQALNHIQKEEQEHGEKIYNYLKSKGAYQA